MHQHYITTLLLPILLFLGNGSTAEAYCKGTDDHFTRVSLLGYPDSDRLAKYVAERLNYLTKKADLTAEEVKILEAELAPYDAKKLELYKKSRALRARLEQKLTESEYASVLEQLLEIEQLRAEVTSNLFERLKPKLSVEKRAKVYVGLRIFDSKVGRRIRGDK